MWDGLAEGLGHFRSFAARGQLSYQFSHAWWIDLNVIEKMLVDWTRVDSGCGFCCGFVVAPLGFW